jgi:hypothetical protein
MTHLFWDGVPTVRSACRNVLSASAATLSWTLAFAGRPRVVGAVFFD